MSQQQPVSPYPQMPMPPVGAVAPRNGLGTAALVLGIIGAASGVIPLFFWLAGILGLLALVFGLVGRGRAKRGQATNKGKATAGAVLGLVSLILSVVGAVIVFKAVDDAVDTVDKALNSDGVAAEKGAPGTEAGKPLGPGQSISFNNGLKITISGAQPAQANEFEAKEGQKAVTFKVTVENTGTKAVTLATDIKPGAEAGADKLYGDPYGKGLSGELAPGKSASIDVAYNVPTITSALPLTVSAGLFGDPAYWALPLG